ncbi:MAG: TlpA disulfide reductase family protein [Clostridia bacterium]
MNAQTLRRFFLCLCCLLLALMPLTAMAAAQEPAAQEPVDVIDMLQKNTKLDLTPYKGKTILLNFFTQWCGYCMEEMPDIKAAYDAYSEDDLQIILVHVWDGEDERNTADVRKTFGMEDMTFFEDEDGSLTDYVGLSGYPASLFISKDGTLSAAFNYMLTKEMLEEQLSTMDVSKKAVAP